MRICASCGYILNDDDMVCPFCGEAAYRESFPGGNGTGASFDAAPETAGVQETSPAEAVAASDEASWAAGTVYMSPEEAEELMSQDAVPDGAEEAPEEETPEDAQADQEVAAPEEAAEEATEAETAAEECITEGSGPAGDVSTAVPEETEATEERHSIFHTDVDPEDRPLRKRNGLFSKAILIMAALALAGMVFGIILPFFRLSDDSDAAKEKAYMNFICGSWISSSFVYSDGSFPTKEIFIVNKDYTFKSYIVVSPDDSEVYDKDTWKVTDTDEGTFSIYSENSAIGVTYTTTSGDQYSYFRYIRSLDSSSMTLREYYNEEMTDYFDVIFTRMEG